MENFESLARLKVSGSIEASCSSSSLKISLFTAQFFSGSLLVCLWDLGVLVCFRFKDLKWRSSCLRYLFFNMARKIIKKKQTYSVVDSVHKYFRSQHDYDVQYILFCDVCLRNCVNSLSAKIVSVEWVYIIFPFLKWDTNKNNFLSFITDRIIQFLWSSVRNKYVFFSRWVFKSGFSFAT